MTNKDINVIQDIEAYMQDSLQSRSQQLVEAGYKMMLDACYDENNKLNTAMLRKMLAENPGMKKFVSSDEFKNKFDSKSITQNTSQTLFKPAQELPKVQAPPTKANKPK